MSSSDGCVFRQRKLDSDDFDDSEAETKVNGKILKILQHKVAIKQALGFLCSWRSEKRRRSPNSQSAGLPCVLGRTQLEVAEVIAQY